MMSKQEDLDSIACTVRWCSKCELYFGRKNTVFGEGDPDAKLMLIGESPDEREDAIGKPFVGRSGKLLEKMLGYIGLDRSKVYVVNIVQCHPTDNRNPEDKEVQCCIPYLEKKIDIIQPKVIVTLGSVATQRLLGIKENISKLKGTWQEFKGIKVLPTFHPSYLLSKFTDENRESVKRDFDKVKAMLAE